MSLSKRPPSTDDTEDSTEAPTPPRVSFSTITIHTVPRMPPQNWYSRQEYDCIRARNFFMTQLLVMGELVEEPRGLEAYTTNSAGTVAAIVREQRTVSTARLALFARQLTLESKQQAIQRGTLDALQATQATPQFKQQQPHDIPFEWDLSRRCLSTAVKCAPSRSTSTSLPNVSSKRGFLRRLGRQRRSARTAI